MNQQRWIKSSLDPFKVHLQMSISGQTGRRRGNMGGHLDVDRVTWKRFPLCRFLPTLIQLALGYTELRSRNKRLRGLLELKVDLSCGGLISYQLKCRWPGAEQEYLSMCLGGSVLSPRSVTLAFLSFPLFLKYKFVNI